MAVRIVLSVKEAWIVGDSLRGKVDHLRHLVEECERNGSTDAAKWVRQDLETIEGTLSKLFSPDNWT